MSNIFTTTIRFNLDIEEDRKALEYLRKTDKFHSYSKAVIAAVNNFAEETEKQDSSFLSSNEKEDEFLKKIHDTIVTSLSTVTPVIHFNVPGQNGTGVVSEIQMMKENADEEINEEDFDAAMDFIDSL